MPKIWRSKKLPIPKWADFSLSSGIESPNVPVQVVIATFPMIYSTYDTLLDLVRSLFQGMGDTTFFLGRRPFFLYGLFGQMESANQINIFLPHLIAIKINYYVQSRRSGGTLLKRSVASPPAGGGSKPDRTKNKPRDEDYARAQCAEENRKTAFDAVVCRRALLSQALNEYYHRTLVLFHNRVMQTTYRTGSDIKKLQVYIYYVLPIVGSPVHVPTCIIDVGT